MSSCAQCGQENPAGARYCHACGAPLPGASEPAETRKTVSVLFCDIVDSTPLGERLDAEAHRRVIGEYFDAVSGVIDRHGGTVEKFIGDAVMAVFGIPRVHEDDALRAVRAASELREAVAPMDRELERDHGVRLRVRVGVATGEVVAGDPAAGQAFATGDTIVTAERLQKAARPSDVLIADATYRLVADAVIAEPVDPVEAKGKATPVAAWRLLGVQPGAPGVARRFDTPLVGRDRELAALREAFDQAVAERRCRLVTVLGAAGIGKSRLVREFLLDVGPDENVLVGRCLPYGDGITFWPLRDTLPDEPLEGTTDEIFSRVRKRFEEIARERPLVLCFDDVHWAEPTFLNLIEYLHGWIADAPVLLLCLARPDLKEQHPPWLSAHGDTVVLTLAPLSGDEVATLVDALEAPSEARDRIAEAAEGNPLFVEQMAAMAAEEGPAFVVPPSIRALIAARLDRLTAEERAIVERAAVFGREFPLRAVVELSPEDRRSMVAGHLLGLMRKELVNPAVITFIDEDGFRFRHALIREVAYEGISKQVRADLHERCARWLDRNGGDDVIIGYHLEQAFRAREQIGRVDEVARGFAREAGELLGGAGQRASARGDMPAAGKLLERAVALLPDDHPERLELTRELSVALWLVGQIDDAEARLNGLLEAATKTGDRRMEWYALLEQAHRRTLIDPAATADELEDVAQNAIRVFAELGDEFGLAQAWRRLSLAPRARGDFASSEHAVERALAHARLAGDRQEQARSIDALCGILQYGPTPVEEALRRCEELLELTEGNRLAEPHIVAATAVLKAMRGDFEEGRALCAQVEVIYEDLGLWLALVGLTEIAGTIELLAGEPVAAERVLRRGYEILASAGDATIVAFQACLLAEAVLAQGRADEAEELVQLAKEGAASDIFAQTHWRAAEGKLEALRGRDERAIALAREAAGIAGRTDALNMHAGAMLRLAEVLRAAGYGDEAVEAGREARALYERKGNVAAARIA
ncbi:MAG TPA: adenylate/guanylate cyclase domain-containing protein, partial [Gaiellaceae bacterium]